MEEGEIISPAKRKKRQKKDKEAIFTIASRPVCKFWMEGQCKKGKECSFSHDAIPNKTAAQVMSEQTCKFELRQACIQGDNCPFSHDK
jgi:cleavage and polyadenylation specificity factor subunit 4